MAEEVKTNIRASVLWSLANRWGSKLIGLINIVVLARLLSPADFGVMAMIGIVIGLLESMTQVGTHLYVFRTDNADERLFSSAWTINVLQGVLIAAGMCALAPFAADYFQQPDVELAIYAMAVVKVIAGFNNYGVFIAQKALNFRVDFAVTMFTRWSFLLGSIAAAIILQSYWALIIGQCVSAIVGLIASYKLHPFRPTFSFYDYQNILKFSYSSLPMSFGRFVTNQIDKIALGRLSTTEYLGRYQVSSGIAMMFTRELLMPILRGMLPNLSAVRKSDRFKLIFTQTVTFSFYLSLPIALAFFILSEEILFVLAGEQWTSAANILSWLAIYCFFIGIIGQCSEQVLLITEHEKLANRLIWIRNAILAMVIWFTFQEHGVDAIPVGLAISMAVFLLPVVIIVTRVTAIPLVDFIAPWLSPTLAAIVMAASLISAQQLFNIDNLYLSLLVNSAIGAIAYLASLATVFILRGKPANTLEAILLKNLKI